MRVALFGYGRMGRAVEAVLKERGHEVAGIFDPFQKIDSSLEITDALLERTDVVIEFSLAEGVMENVKRYCGAGLSAVIGTTGWDGEYARVKKDIERHNSGNREAQIGCVAGSNFSIGANLLFWLTREAALLAAKLEESSSPYDMMISEIHHRLKRDFPSGTALKLAQVVKTHWPLKSDIVDRPVPRALEPHELQVSSLRGGSEPGTHSVFLDSKLDTIEITHRVRDRSVFAYGAVVAAEWMCEGSRKGFYTIDDMMHDMFSSQSST